MGSLAQQVFSTQVKYFVHAFLEATKKEHGYVLLDLHPLTPDMLRVRSRIFKPGELEIYAPAGGHEDQTFELEPSGYIKISEQKHPHCFVWISQRW